MYCQSQITEMKTFTEANATIPNHDERLTCITTLDKCVQILNGLGFMPAGQRISDPYKTKENGLADEILKPMGLIGQKAVIWALTSNGKKPVDEENPPEKLASSISSSVIAIGGTYIGKTTSGEVQRGYYVFLLSAVDGFHSLVITLDYRNDKSPKLYLSDQRDATGGWKQYSADELDAYILKMNKDWFCLLYTSDAADE